MSEIHDVENDYLAPPAPKCLHWKDFLLPPDPMFLCRDIWEEQLEKTIAYNQTLQYWAERANLPMPGQPCLLERSVLELRQYISFSDDTILDGVVLPEGFLIDQTELTISSNAPSAFTDVPTEEVTVEEAAPIRGPLEEPTTPQNQFPSWRKVLHPSQSVATARKASLALSKLRWRHHHQSSGEKRAQCQRVEEHLHVKWAEQDSLSPKSPEPMQEVALPPGFKEVMACLQRDLSPVTAFKAPLESMQPEVMVEPMVAMVCVSCIMQDKATGITYMETVTTSVGQVALRCSYPIVPPLRKKLITTFGWEDYHTIWQEHLYAPLWQWGSAVLF